MTRDNTVQVGHGSVNHNSASSGVAQRIAGVALTALGLLDLGGAIPFLASYAYAIVWWGVLLLVDDWNRRRRGLSLWSGQLRHFAAVTLPASVLVWLLFELLNLPAPQWRYRGAIEGIWPKVLFGFVAFSTVIPIMVEAWWLVGGRQCLPEGFARWFQRNRLLSFSIAAVAAIVPFFNQVFWFNQGIWLVPALVLLPLVRTGTCSGGAFARVLVSSALIAGVAWETFNFKAATHWEYLILPDAPHLFFMPLPGYIGFVPFGISMLAVYEFQRRLRPTMWLAFLLYTIAIAGLYWLTVLYVERGIWISAPAP